MILDTFTRVVQDHGLLAPGDRVLAAVSGGGDSVAMLRLLLEYAERVPLTIFVAHVNHRLRGRAADEDQRFVEQTAARLGLECVVLAPAAGWSGRDARRVSSEETARLMRHRLLARAARERSCTRIALGHTMDDQAETILMRLARGAGRRGLSGMARSGPGLLIRPMLDIGREEARDYLRALGQPCREDETNADPRYLRNRVRSRLLPLLREMNPSIVSALARNGILLAEEDAYLDGQASDWLAARSMPDESGLRVPAGALSDLPRPLARRVARMMVKHAGGDPRGASLSVIEGILDVAGRSRPPAVRPLVAGMTVAREGADLVVRRGPPRPEHDHPAPFSVTLEIPGRVTLPAGRGTIEARVVARDQLPEPVALPGSAPRAALDAKQLGTSVTVRNRLAGDAFHPLGAPGRRTLKRFLIDQRAPRDERSRIPLVVGASGIAWVVGYRIGHAYRVTESTRLVALLEYSP